MKLSHLTGTALVAAILAFGALSLDAQGPAKKRTAFGSILFGDNEQEAVAHNLENLADMNRRHVMKPMASELMTFLIYKGSKFPPKLANRFSKTVIGFTLGGDNITSKDRYPIRTITMPGDQHPMAEFQTNVKSDWEVLRDIASAKFEHHVQLSPFPAEINKGAPASGTVPTFTDQWTQDGIEIKLALIYWPIAGGKCEAVLLATDTTIPPAM